MKQLCVTLLVILTLAGAFTAAAAGGAPPPQAASVPAVTGDTVFVHDTLAWVRNNTIGTSFGPSKRTGYGKATITSIVRGCPECGWYRATLSYTNHQPTSPMTSAASADAGTRRGGLCWPWEFDLFSGDACWNDASTWNWGGIFSIFDDNWHPWNPDALSITDRLAGCLAGAESGLTLKLAGAAAAAGLEASLSPLSVTPEGWIVAGIGGCIGNPFH